MIKKEILDSIKDFSSEFPKEALKEIQANKADFISELIDSLDYVYHNATELSNIKSNYFLHIYAMYLLAEFREKKAFPYLLSLLRLPEKEVDFIIGETLTEDYKNILLCTFDKDNIHLLLNIIEDAELFEWARLAAFRTYESLQREGFINKEEAVLYIKSLIHDKLPTNDSDLIFTAVSGWVIDAKIFEMIPDVRFLYDNERIDTSYHGDYDGFIDWLFKEDKHVDEVRYIDDAVSEMEGWHCFNQKSEKTEKDIGKGIEDFIYEGIEKDKKIEQAAIIKQLTAQKQPKPGRNERCYCGSGKKYKKCCLNSDQKPVQKNEVSAESAVKVEEKYDLLKNYPKNSQEFDSMFEEEAIVIDKFVYKALCHRQIPIWVKRDRERERIGKIDYLKQALNLFLDKCKREQITSFAAYDEKFIVHYRSHEWISALINLIENNDSNEIKKLKIMAEETYQKFISQA